MSGVRVVAGAGVVFGVAAVAGEVYPGDRVVVGQLLGHPFLYGSVGCLLLAMAAGWGLPGARGIGLAWRVVVVVGGVLVGGMGAWFGFLFSNWYGWHETQHLAAPDGRPVRVVVEEGDDLDHYWVIYVENGQGLGRRRYEAACLSDDDPDQGLTRITWSSPGQLRLTTEGYGTFTIPVSRRGLPSAVPPEIRCW